ncbi:kynureninase [Pseudovirgaria hyperparasitica]|uniref:Kynureninase n=1 Tax=Pseudovirgaria hyperparasitica TaxID=470096 RepID=A0A6A6WEI2_9PEZI|nr:kynureninase [Pseudovirgaria hyperparasitica]KAF2760945.1 kynureninase [Pseudovirgaria hyperparasitica]
MALDHLTQTYADEQDAADPLRHLRDEFIIPTRHNLENTGVASTDSDTQCTYLCGNSLGVQPKRARKYIHQFLDSWSQQGVFGHFKQLKNSFLPPWVHMDDAVKNAATPLFGALPTEVAIMETLTANLHLAMASFYKPTKERYKIIIEGKAFPSDHYAAISQLEHHGLPPSALICITPPDDKSPYLPTDHICAIISEHAASTALVLLPGIQYYSGQLFDIATITAHAHSLGLVIGWDLAHAAGNVPLQLHDWDVDFAVWCNYKYLNSGPGAIGGLFVHEKHGIVTPKRQTDGGAELPAVIKDGEQIPELEYRPRLSGWWGNEKSTRFRMEPQFHPRAGAAGYQLSNPSALDISSVMASLSVFNETSMPELRSKSLKVTKFLEDLLVHRPCRTDRSDANAYEIITPMNPAERGAQISVKVKPGFLDTVMEVLEAEGVVVDERQPDVVRVAPAPLYNNHRDVWDFHVAFEKALEAATAKAGEAQ